VNEAFDLVVVGAGIAGLSAAWRARRAGRSVVVLEASPRVGGVIRTDRVGGYRVERAAAAFPSTAEHLLEIHASLPEGPRVHEPPREANRQFLLTTRGLVSLPRSPPAFLASPLMPMGAKARALLEFARGPRRGGAPETAHGFVRRRFGRTVAESLLRPLTLGIYGADPSDLGLADAFPALATMERESGSLFRALSRRRGAARREMRTFEGGMETFPRAIAAALGDAVRTGVGATALRGDAEGVAVVGSDGVERRAAEALLATTADAQARLVEPLSEAAAAILGAVRYAPMVVVAVGLPPGASPAIPRAFGFLRGAGSRARLLGASIPSNLDPAVAPEGHALLSAFVGGASDPDALALDDDEVRTIVERDLSRALRGPVRPDLVEVRRHPRAIPVFSVGHRARMGEAQRLLAPRRVRLWGSHVSGVGIHACCAPPH
jgi:oxygen-dependent protoporphyrinogen oxidase